MKSIITALAMVVLLAGSTIADDDRPYPTTMKELEQQQAEDREEFRRYEPQMKKLHESIENELEKIRAKKAEEAARKKKSWW